MPKGPVVFMPGETILLRHAQRDRLGLVVPHRVVSDTEEAVLLWVPAGSRGWHFTMPDGRNMPETPLPEWSASRRVPAPHTLAEGLLCWHPRGRDYSIRWIFSADGAFSRWYANLEAPAVTWRDPGMAGLDTSDWDLDVVIRPDRSWEWKDEDEFAERLTMPESYWVDDEQRVRQAGKDVIALAEAGEFPFDGTWCDFRPDPDWPALPRDLPAGWDRPVAPRP